MIKNKNNKNFDSLCAVQCLTLIKTLSRLSDAGQKDENTKIKHEESI